MSYSHGHLEPRVLISYARADGEEISQSINELLVSKGIPVWQDKVGAVGMEGGKDWWQQIAKAIDKVEFLVLVATKAALESKNVKKEWLYARQQGVCVYPVKASPHLDYTKLPRWMKSLHFYDLEHEQEKFINDLNTRCEATKVPFMAGDMPDDYVDRPDKVNEAISYLVDRQNDGVSIPCNVVLHGAGGFGKTTLLKAICHSEDIRDAFDDGILWVTLGQDPTPTDLVFKVLNLIETISGKRPGVTDLETVLPFLRQLLSDKDLLIVIDDVWNPENLEPFLEGGSRSSRLISTRNLDIIPKNAKRVHIDAMTKDEAAKLLGSGLSTDDNYHLQLSMLATRLGEWPLLLKLVNRAIYHRVTNGGQSLQQAIEYSSKALAQKGLTYFDIRNAASRQQAVAKTLSVGIDLLNENERGRYTELAVFFEDIDIPLSTLHKLWSKTGGLDEFDTEKLCESLERLSLVYSFDLNSKTIRLHDVIRKYLLEQHNKENLSRLHILLLEVYSNNCSWEDLDWTQVDDYGLQHLSRHAYELRDNEAYRQELYQLVCAPFTQEKFTRYGSYQSLAIDMDLVIRAAQSEKPPNVPQLVRGIIANTTLELTVSKIPIEALWTLSRVGKEKKALEYASLMDSYSLIDAHRLIADALIDLGEEDKAKEILHNILNVSWHDSGIDPYERMELSSKLGYLSERIGMLSETLSVTLPFGEGSWERNQALKLLTDYLAQSRLFHQAVMVANKIVGSQRMKSFALSNIVHNMTKEGAFEEAKMLIEQTDQDNTILASIELAEGFISLSKGKEAKEILQQAQNRIELVSDQSFKAVLLNASSIVLLLIGEEEQAIETIRRAETLIEEETSHDVRDMVKDIIISRDEETDLYYRSLAYVLKFEEMLDIARATYEESDEVSKTDLVIIFTAVLAERGNLTQAQAVASTGSGDRQYVLFHAAEVLANDGHLERALDIAELCLQEKIVGGAAWILKEVANVMVRRREGHNTIEILNRMRSITQRVIDTAKDTWHRDYVKDTYTGLAMALAFGGITDEAKIMADNAINAARTDPNNYSNYLEDESMEELMTTIITELVNSGLFDQARSVAISTHRPSLKPALHIALIDSLVKAGQKSIARGAVDELLNFLHETTDIPTWKVYEYKAQALAWREDIDGANEVIAQIELRNDKCLALANMAQIFVELRQFTLASAVTDTVLKLAAEPSDDIDHSNKRDTLIILSKVLAILQDSAGLNKAIVIAKAMDNKYLAKDWTIKEIAIVLAGIGEITNAIETIEEGISDESMKSFALSNIVQYRTEREAFGQARELTLEKINHEACKALALGEMARYMIRKDGKDRSDGLEYCNQALEFAEISITKKPFRTVDDWDVTALALSRLAQVFADMQEFDLAERLIDMLETYEESISHTKHKIVALGITCQRLAQSGQIDRALLLWIKHLVGMHHKGLLAGYKRDYIIRLVTAALPFLAMIDQGKDLWRAYEAIVEIEGWRI